MRVVDLLVVGAGEYVTGFACGAASASDKTAGVVALVAFDLRMRGKLGRMGIAARDETRFPAIRRHFSERIAAPYGLDPSFEPLSLDALCTFPRGAAVVIVTPDDTHFPLAMAAIERGLHVLVAKPLVHTLEQHLALEAAARERGVLLAVELHKRWDPMYADARERARELGDCSYFTSYMSQPRAQLETFRAWAGRSSDISYYLNAHHVDMHAWIMEGRGRPLRVTASASRGVGQSVLERPVEDTIALQVEWENLPSGHRAVATYAASWIAPRSDVHSQQRFFYLGHAGEVSVDQAHRGYQLATDARGLASPNPLFMRYTPVRGRFAGQGAYGYRSIEAFVDAVAAIENGHATPSSMRDVLGTAESTRQVTAILEAGRRSLDEGAPIVIEYDARAPLDPVRLR